MNRIVLGLVLGLAIGSGATWFVLHHSSADEAAKPDAPKAADAAKPEEKPNPLRLPPAQRTAAGIVLVKPEETSVPSEVRGFGRVLDTTSLVAVVADLDAAQAASSASGKELDRVQKLFAAGGNASAQAVETAQAAVARDRAAVASAQTRLGSTWGREVAQNVAPLAEALRGGATLVRIDLLPGEASARDVKQARVSLAGSADTFAAEVLGPAPMADAQVQGVSYLALVREQPLPVGAALRATLPGTAAAASGLVVPRSAVVYHQGSPWIYVLGEEDTFERKLVSLGRTVGDNIVIATGTESGEQVVATGAQQLLAAELQAGSPPEEP